jgi:hypothetical protein
VGSNSIDGEAVDRHGSRPHLYIMSRERALVAFVGLAHGCSTGRVRSSSWGRRVAVVCVVASIVMVGVACGVVLVVFIMVGFVEFAVGSVHFSKEVGVALYW